MGWPSGVVVLLALRYIVEVAGVPHTPQDLEVIDQGTRHNSDNIVEDNNEDFITLSEDFKLEQLGRILANVLMQPWPKGVSPILYVEEYPPQEVPSIVEDPVFNNMPLKRTRYYRKYPWKRQNSRYDAENRYLCQPSKEDVFRLLVALHEARQGNRGQVVNFCNRRKPAATIFTNIRFLG